MVCVQTKSLPQPDATHAVRSPNLVQRCAFVSVFFGILFAAVIPDHLRAEPILASPVFDGCRPYLAPASDVQAIGVRCPWRIPGPNDGVECVCRPYLFTAEQLHQVFVIVGVSPLSPSSCVQLVCLLAALSRESVSRGRCNSIGQGSS